MNTTAKQIAKEVIKQATQIGNSVNKTSGLQVPMREKYWSEIDTKEKIERLRNLVKSQLQTISRLEQELNRFKRHSHNEKGEAVIVESLSGYYGGNEIAGGSLRNTNDKDEVYI